MEEFERIEAEEVQRGQQLPKVNVENAPRDLNSLMALPRIVRWRLALSLGFPDEQYKTEFHKASAFIQSHMLRGALKSYDSWRRTSS
jgi:hypothetical protein